MRCVGFLALVILAITCGPSPDARLPPNLLRVTGGTTEVGSGGLVGSGGASTVTGSGGAVAGSGGRPPGTGGRGSGGVTSGTGGQNQGSGGRTNADAGLDLRPNRDVEADTRPGTGGTSRDAGTVVGTGGRPDGGTLTSRDGAAGASGTGGTAGGSGGVGTGGATTTGGTTGTRDGAAGTDAAGSCYTTLIDNGYACGAAAPCSACKVNGVSKETECQTGIDCLAAAGPTCDSNCQLSCYNKAGDAQVQACIKALQTAACGGAGC